MTIDTKNLRTLAEDYAQACVNLEVAVALGHNYSKLIARHDETRTALLDALERKDRLLNAACNALQLQPRQTREVWKDGIDIDIAVPHTKARDAAIEAITKELT